VASVVAERLSSWAAGPFSEANLGWTIAAAAALAGIALRVWSIQEARFSAEESWFWSIGRDIATGRSFPALGHPISGTSARHPGAAFFWFLGLTQLFGPSPMRAYATVSLGGMAVLAPLSFVVARAFDRATGLSFFLLAAVSPWWIVYTNAAWPGYLFPTSCALLLVWLPSIVEASGARKRLAQASLAFLLVVGFQLHLSLLHYWLITAVTVAVWRPKLTRPLLFGLAAGCLCYVPYLVHEWRHGFANTIAIAHRSQGSARSVYVLQGLVLYFLGFTTTDISYLWKQGFWFPFDLARFWRGSGVEQTSGFFARVGWAPAAWAGLVASWIFTILSWGAFARVLWRRLRRNAADESNVLPIAFVTAVAGIPLLYLLSGKGGYPHYVSTVLPLAFLPPAFLLGQMFRHRVARWGAGAYVVVFAIAGFWGLRGYYAVDSRWSIPQTTAAVDFILHGTRLPGGRYVPFKLDFGFSPAWKSSYQLVATHVFGAPFLAGDDGDTFRIDARLPGQPVAADGNTLVLPTLAIKHQAAGLPSAGSLAR
jgi:hypothetical protein